MVVITKGAIHQFVSRHPRAAGPLNEWFEKTEQFSWKNFSAVKKTFNTVDAIGNDRFVFDIAGNHFRLVAMIHFTIRTVYIRAILTHREYETLSKANKLTTL